MRLPRVMPFNLAMEMALTGEPVSAERLAELGVVNRVTDPGGALDAAFSWRDDCSQRAPRAAGLEAHPA